MSLFRPLTDELDRWADEGAVATLWWRDDDAVAPTPALDRLIASADGVPLTLAVIPALAEPALAARLVAHDGIAAVQHGLAHRNHETVGKKAELGAARAVAEVMADLAVGFARLSTLFGAQFRPMLVPPWNRIAAQVVPALPRLGLTALSTARPRPGRSPGPGLVQVNTHVDPIDWRGTRGFMGATETIDLMCRHLADRREGRVDRHEPTGLLTHHLVHDAGLWQFLPRLVEETRAHRAVRFLTAAEACA
jgi:peptidoglycan/xylan/chitin deacetylase (PgdA/CDA1 family)